MKLYFIFITSMILSLLTPKAFATNPIVRKQIVTQLEREHRLPLLARSKALYPFTFLGGRGGRYTVYEPADKLTLFADGGVSYVRFDELGEIAFRGYLSADDMLVKLPNQVMGGFRKGQKVCVSHDTFYLPAGTALRIKDFYEQNYVTLYQPGLFRALDSRSFAVSLYEISNCR